MALRFQGRDDDVDRAAKEARATGVTVFFLALYAAVFGAIGFFEGWSLIRYEQDLTAFIAFGFVYWLTAPYYHEFRIRTKEIDGKVSAIEKAVNAETPVTVSRIEWTVNELLERLTAIEGKLDAMQR